MSTTKKIKIQNGDCYVLQSPSGHYTGFGIYSVGMKYCSFLLSGNPFSEIPDIEEFKNSGLWGLKVISGIYPNFVIRFCERIIPKKNMLENLKKAILVGNTNIPSPIYMGNQGMIEQLKDIEDHIESFKMINEKRENEKYIYPIQVFNWTDLDAALFSEKDRLKTQWRLNKKKASSRAIELMNDKWLWSETDEFAPFGNDAGSDTLYSFKIWRDKSPYSDIVSFIDELKSESFIPESLDTTVSQILKSMHLDKALLNSYHRSIIAAAFGQLVLEGVVSPSLKNLALQAISTYKKDMLDDSLQPKHHEEFIFKIDFLKQILEQV
jgi:uncharacterized protein YfeS